MENQASRRQSSRISTNENIKPNLKRKATMPLTVSDPTERPALRNLTNQSKNTDKKIFEQKYEKKVPNYLKPTFSTQQKCIKKKVELHPGKSTAKKGLGVSKVPSAQISQKTIKEPTVSNASGKASENFFDFEEETEDKMSSENMNKEVKNQKKPLDQDMASPLRIEIVTTRKFIPSTPKPPVNHVLSVLKSSLSSPLTKTPRTVETKLPQFFKTATPKTAVESSFDSVPFDNEVNTSFDQPPRRSYSRQRPLTNFCEFDEPSSDEENKEEEKEKVPEIKEPEAKAKKQKRTNKTAQDKQFEKLAAAMNSQFSEVEGFQLVVE